MKKTLLAFMLVFTAFIAKAQFPNPYCAEAYSSGVEPITSVVFSDINNTSPAPIGGPAHQDFLSVVGNVTAGNSYTMTVKGNTDGNFSDYIRVFIDWNNNNLFTDAGESFNIGIITNSTGLDAISASASISIPGGQPTGNRRMRVTKKWNAYQAPCNTTGYGESEDYTLSITAAAGCSGTPAGGTAIASPSVLCTTGNSTISLSGATSTPGITYQWQSSPAGLNTFTDIGGATSSSYNATGISASTDYRCRVTCTNGGANTNSAIATVSVTGVPVNDAPCGAITLTQGGGTHCGNTTCATSTGDPTLFCSTPNNTVWYTYTPAANGTVDVRLSRNGAGPHLNGWVQFYTATGTCPTLTLTQVNAGACLGNVDLTTVASGTVSSPALTGGTTYYIMVDGFSGSFGAYCIELVAPPPPPSCVTNVSPANGATGVAIAPPSGAASITWNAAATATSYDVYFGTVNPPTALIGNIAAPAVTVSITGLQYDSTYYWYIVPKNGSSAATGCSTNTTSFTAQSAPPICTPFTTTGCGVNDRIDLFRLKGESSEININTGASCSSIAYVDSTDYATVIDLARGKSYWGQIKAGTTGDYVTIWLDANDNGLFENSERLMNNILVSDAASGTNINLFIPLTTALGNHRLRARLVYYGSAPTIPTTPCGSYTYSDTRDYLVNIVAGGSPYTVATYTPTGICYKGAGSITVDAASNNNSNFVPLVDSSNALVAQIYPQGNNLGTVTASYYKHNGPVRQDPQGIYYMDRNITVSVTQQPVTPYNIRLPYLNSELNALIAQPGSGVTDQFSLAVTKNGDSCRNAVNFGGTLYSPTGWGTIGGVGRFVDVPNLSGFSSFWLHGGGTPIPVKVEYFRGAKQGINHVLDWKVSCQNTQYAKMTIEVSKDSRNFNGIYTIKETALRCQQPFSFANTNPFAGINYYRLRMEDDHGVVTYSSIVALINGIKGFELVNITPNPVTDGRFKLNITSAEQKKMEVMVTDIAGRVVLKQTENIISGFNAIDMNVSKLAGGTYQIYGVTGEGKTRVLQFVKH